MKDLLTGSIGLVTSVVFTPILASAQDPKIINAVVQVLIAIVTLIGLLRKKK